MKTYKSESSLADGLKTKRRIKRITLKQLSEKTGLSLSYLSMAENNKRNLSIDQYVMIAKELGYDMSITVKKLTKL